MVLVLLVLSGGIELNPGPPGNGASSPSLSAHSIPLGRDYKLKGFSVIHLNVRSLCCHLDKLVDCVMFRMSDVVAVSETWLDKSISSNHLAIPGTSCSDRTETGMVGE